MSEPAGEHCEECGKDPVGVTMWPEMDGWSCPYCGHYNELNPDSERQGATNE